MPRNMTGVTERALIYESEDLVSGCGFANNTVLWDVDEVIHLVSKFPFFHLKKERVILLTV